MTLMRKRIVFGINMGVDHCSRSVVEGAKIHAFEANYPTSSPNPFPALILSPSSSTTTSSLFSPLSHIPQIGSPFYTDRFLEVFDEYVPLDPDYYLITKGGAGFEENHSLVFDVSLVKNDNAESEDLKVSSEHIYESDIDEKNRNSHLEKQEKYTRVAARGNGYKTVTTCICNDCSVIEPQPPRRAVGGLTALFGTRTK